MTVLVDTHCHLNFENFRTDRAEVLERALQAGVGGILIPGTDLESSREAVALAQAFPQIRAAVGVHPNDALSWREGSLGELQALGRLPEVVAVGEIGLDYYREYTPHPVQRQVFAQQLELAAQLERPVIVHTRNRSREDEQATADTLAMLAEWQADLAAAGSPLAGRPGVLHSYAGSLAHAQQAIASQFRIGITGPITFKNATLLQQFVEQVPIEWLLIETDAPFLTPQPHRGKRNEPAYVRLVAEKLSEILNLPFETIGEITTSNAERLFHWRVRD